MNSICGGCSQDMCSVVLIWQIFCLFIRRFMAFILRYTNKYIYGVKQIRYMTVLQNEWARVT